MISLSPGWNHYLHPQYELDLIQNPDILKSRYSNHIHQWIEKGESEKWTVMKSQSPNDLINLWRFEHRRPDKKVEPICRRILSRGLQTGNCEIYSVYSPFNNLVASGVFFYFQKTVTLLFYSQGNDRFNEMPFSLLIDHFLMTHAGRDLTLNLEVLSSHEKSGSFYKFPIPAGLNTVELYESIGFKKMHFPVIERARPVCLEFLFRTSLFP